MAQPFDLQKFNAEREEKLTRQREADIRQLLLVRESVDRAISRHEKGMTAWREEADMLDLLAGYFSGWDNDFAKLAEEIVDCNRLPTVEEFKSSYRDDMARELRA
jgi:hypothetical protein